MALGNKIQEIRKTNNLTQEQFAQRFHVTRQTVSNWENDKNYPDMWSLKIISDEYGISFDELLKEDEKYIKSVDNTKKKMSILKRILIVSLVILITLVVGFFVALYMAFQPTPDGERINSDTTVKMWVDLENATPSRAITYTTDKNRNYGSYKSTVEKYKSSALGGVEGDIPAVILKDSKKIVLHFQDLQYNNVTPDDIIGVSCDLYDVTSNEQKSIKHDLKYYYKNGKIVIILDPKMFKANEDGEVWYTMIIVAEYKYKGKEYTSVTALTVFDK